MIKRKDIRIGYSYIHKGLDMHLVLTSFSPGHEPLLGMVTLKSGHFTWMGSLRDFLYNFTNI